MLRSALYSRNSILSLVLRFTFYVRYNSQLFHQYSANLNVRRTLPGLEVQQNAVTSETSSSRRH